MFDVSPFYQGLAVGFGLIIAIGVQNAFVIKQGLLKNHVFIIAFICASIDAILIIIGVAGLGVIISSNPILLGVAKYGGIVFLLCYAAKSFHNAFKGDILYISNDNAKMSLNKAIVTTFAVSLLNPHLYIDTCLLIGSIGSNFQGSEKFDFAFGAISASFIWFFTISYAARLLIPIFQQPIAWKILDFIIGVIMCVIATSLMMWDLKYVSPI